MGFVDAGTWTSTTISVDLHDGKEAGPRLLADVHARRSGAVFTGIVRPALAWDLGPSVSVALGGALVGQYGEATDDEVVLEARVWEQVLLTRKVDDLALGLRLRLEQRFLPDGAGHRGRVWARAAVPLGGQLSLVATDEVFVGTLGPGAPVAFDQNRAFLGPALPLADRGRLELGYAHVWTQRGDVNTHLHVIASNLFLTL